MIEEIIFEARLRPRSGSAAFQKDPTHICGVSDVTLSLREHLKVQESDTVELRHTNNSEVQELEYAHFPPGSVIALRLVLF